MQLYGYIWHCAFPPLSFVDQVRSAKDYVVLFDESLNGVAEMKQMDVMVRLWDVDKVTTRYFLSKFVGHAYADKLSDELF